MYLVEFEFFIEAGLSKVANNGDSYPKDMLVAHLSILDASNKVFKASHMCTSYENYEGNFFFDNVAYPFYLDISKDSAFAFSMDEPFSLVVLPNVLSLIAPSASGGSSGGTVDFSSVISEIQSLGNGLYSYLSNVSDVVVSNATATTNTINASFKGVNTLVEGVQQQISNIDLSKIDFSKIEALGKYNLLDLNGQFGSYRNGTKVLISGHTEEYTVLSSSLIWDDKMGVLMITYNLKNVKDEICPSSHPLLSLVPATPTTPTNGG